MLLDHCHGFFICNNLFNEWTKGDILYVHHKDLGWLLRKGISAWTGPTASSGFDTMTEMNHKVEVEAKCLLRALYSLHCIQTCYSRSAVDNCFRGSLAGFKALSYLGKFVEQLKLELSLQINIFAAANIKHISTHTRLYVITFFSLLCSVTHGAKKQITGERTWQKSLRAAGV